MLEGFTICLTDQRQILSLWQKICTFDSQCCLKKYSDFGGGKKNNLIRSFCHYSLMSYSGKKFRALRDKKKNSNSRFVRKKNSERNKKT
jgi:hypothetical protein